MPIPTAPSRRSKGTLANAAPRGRIRTRSDWHTTRLSRTSARLVVAKLHWRLNDNRELAAMLADLFRGIEPGSRQSALSGTAASALTRSRRRLSEHLIVVLQELSDSSIVAPHWREFYRCLADAVTANPDYADVAFSFLVDESSDADSR